MKQLMHIIISCLRAATRLTKRNPLWLSILIGGLLGLITFLCIYGIGIVNPFHTEWLKLAAGDPFVLGQDLKQHYLGWQWYRDAPWTWPIGLITTQSYPTGIPVTYLDAIPLLAIPFKLISGILPTNFQYIGLWQLACFILQGMFAAIIVRKATRNLIIILAGSVLFVFSSILMMRIFFHPALASQWLILLGIALLLYRRRLTTKQNIAAWIITFILIVLIHPYFIPMVAVLFFASIVLSHHSWKETVIKILLPLLVSILIFWVIGGFVATNIDTEGLGFHPFDLSSPFRSYGWSVVNDDSPIVIENVTYIGLGVVYALVITILLFAYKVIGQIDFRNQTRIKLKKYFNIRYLIVYVSFLFLFAMALSPVVQWNGRTIFTYPVPGIVKSFWGVFRSSTRLIWPIYYLLITGAVFGLVKVLSRSIKLMTCVFIFIALIQFIDVGLSPNVLIREKSIRYVQTLVHSPQLNVDRWLVFTKGKKHMVYLDSKLTVQDSYSLSDVATPARLTMNEAYYARIPVASITSTRLQARNELISGKIDKDTVYVTHDVALLHLRPLTVSVLYDNNFYGIISS